MAPSNLPNGTEQSLSIWPVDIWLLLWKSRNESFIFGHLYRSRDVTEQNLFAAVFHRSLGTLFLKTNESQRRYLYLLLLCTLYMQSLVWISSTTTPCSVALLAAYILHNLVYSSLLSPSPSISERTLGHWIFSFSLGLKKTFGSMAYCSPSALPKTLGYKGIFRSCSCCDRKWGPGSQKRTTDL